MTKSEKKSSPEAIIKSILMLRKINPNLSDRQLVPMAADLINNYTRTMCKQQMEICASRVFPGRYSSEERTYIANSNMPEEVSKDTDPWIKQEKKENETTV